MALTKLISQMNTLGVYPQNWKEKDDVNQESIDKISDTLLKRVTNQDIINHNITTYNRSTQAYVTKESNQNVIPELSLFMKLLKQDELVLDLGSGHGRDTLYMVDQTVRNNSNQEEINTPKHTLQVVPFEGSKEFLELTLNKVKENLSKIPLMVQGDFTKPGNGIPYYGDHKELISILTKGNLQPIFNGIWSCAAYLVHMPNERLNESIAQWSKTLVRDGIFAVSYIPTKKDQSTVFLASRSAPGEIKVFSHYSSKRIDEAFSLADLTLIDMTSGDYNGHGHVMKDFFTNAFYKKL